MRKGGGLFITFGKIQKIQNGREEKKITLGSQKKIKEELLSFLVEMTKLLKN